METKFNFKSQICTTREQSERLIALGLKKETADMCWTKMAAIRGTFYVPELAPINMVSWRHTPAWSLHRLIEMMPEDVSCDNVSEYFTIGKDFFAGQYVTYGQLFWKEGRLSTTTSLTASNG